MFAEADIEILTKKDQYFKDAYEKFDKAELVSYSNIHRRFWHSYSKIWNCKKEIIKLGEKKIDLNKSRAKFDKWYVIFALLFAVESFFREKSAIELGVVFLAFGIFYLWTSILHHMSEIQITNEIASTKRLISLLEVNTSELSLTFLPDMDVYMKLYDEGLSAALEQKGDDSATIKKFNVELNLAILSSMGYEKYRYGSAFT
jgi:hypothetical protein